MTRRLVCALGAVALVAGATAARAQHAEDMLIGSTAPGGGELGIAYDFGVAIVATPSFTGGGLVLHVTTDPGFDALLAPDSVNGLFPLAAGTEVGVEIVAVDTGASLKLGTVLDAPGATAPIGTMPALHVHPEWQLVLPEGAAGTRQIAFRLTTPSAAYDDSPVFTATVTNDLGGVEPSPSPAPTPTAVGTPAPAACGDVDGNGVVDVIDAANVQRAAVGLPSACGAAPARCDADGSGVIDVIDAANVQRAAVGLPALLACPDL